MRNRLLTLFSMAFIAIASFAQSWTEPEEPTEGSDVVSGHVYRVKNVEYEAFLAGGQAWYSWATSTILVQDNPLSFTITYDEAKQGYTLARTTDGKFTFISGTNPGGNHDGWGEMHVDMGSQGHQYFEFLKQDNGYYHIRAVASDDTYGENMEGYETKCWGRELSEESGTPNAVYATVVPGDEFSCDWEFIDMSLYTLQKELFDLTAEIEEQGYDISYDQYEEAYYSGDYDQTKAAYDELKALVDYARVYAVLAVGEDGINPPSDKNPCDATSLIKNASFDAGNIEGWTCTFKSGTNANNVGYQSATYTNGDVQISKFIEAWAGYTNFSEWSYIALGDGELSQTLEALPQGKYKFTCNAIAHQQNNSAANPVTGVELFATGGELEQVQNIATGNGVPEHFEITFVSTGGDITMGLRTKNTTANWIAADVFTLTYYGEVEGDPAKILLDAYIAELEEKYGDVYNVSAEQNVKNAYETAINTAKDATEDYEAVKTELEVAAKALQESIDEYAKLKNTLNSLSKQIRMASTDWTDLAFELGDLQNAFQSKYEDGTATSEEIAALPDSAYNMCADFISAALLENPEGCIGKEITLLLKNPGFDTEFSGWTVNKGNIVWGGENVGPLPDDHPAYPYTVEGIVDGGCAEKWHEAFDICQTIKNMPAGVFQLSCQAFERIDDGGQLWAELYATLNGNTQTKTVKDIADDAQETALYNPEYGGGHGEAGTHNGDTQRDEGYVPNGMSSSNVYFRAGLYKNYFDIVVGMPSDMTVGIRTTNAQNWVLFDDFKIVYKGEDIEKYKELINEKMKDLTTMLEENEVAVTDSVLTVVEEAKEQAETALESNVGKTCTDAIQALLDATAAVTANLELMQAFADAFWELYDFRYTQEGLEGDMPEIMEEIEDKIDPDGDEKFENDAEVEKARIELVRAYNQFVQECLADGASEDEPADITYVIYNPTNDSYDPDATDPVGVKGWNVPYGTVGYGSPTDKSMSEFYQTDKFEINQTIYGLNPGYYRLKVYGLYRDGYSARIDSCLNKVEGFIERANVKLFAGDASTELLPISEYCKRYTELVEEDTYENVTTGNSAKITIKNDSTEEEVIYIPNMVAAAKTIFNFTEDDDVDRLYENILQFKVEEGAGDITIGLCKDAEDNVEGAFGDWTVWDEWKLEFIGTDEPSIDATTHPTIATAIKDIVSTVVPFKSAAIYNLAGQRVSKAVKGIYIINGKKVVIK